VNFFKQIQLGLNAYKEAHAFIKQHNFYSYFFIPILFNLVLFVLFSGLVWHYAQMGSDYIYYTLNIENFNFGNFSFLKGIIHFAISFIFKLLGLVLYMIIFRNIVLILMAPVLTIVSEKTEEIISGKTYSFEWLQFVKDAVRGIVIAIKNSLKEVFYTLVIFLLSFIPVIGLAASFLVFFMQSYFYGFSMIDYTLERAKMDIAESENFIWKHKWLAVAIGTVFNLLVAVSTTFSIFPSVFVSFFLKVFLLIPLIALSAAPIYGVVAGTLATLKVLKP
jgi:CysZ protein